MRPFLVAFAAAALMGCARERTETVDTTAGLDTAAPPALDAGVRAVLRDSAGRELGTLAVAEMGDGLTVSGSLRGLAPGQHAIHLHAVGRCEPPFESAGPHWNPTNRRHGSQNPQGPHFGDMPNITVGSDRTATVNVTTPGGTLRGENGLLDGDGAAVVVHARADDNRTDPAGNAGARVACGEVQG